MGQALAMVVFTSITVSGTPASYRATAAVAFVTCVTGACLFFLYNEKMILAKIEEYKAQKA
jgi:GPH family glycoside/pentoside/hexuronide:cation symporter